MTKSSPGKQKRLWRLNGKAVANIGKDLGQVFLGRKDELFTYLFSF